MIVGPTILSALWLIAGAIYFGWKKPAYSHWRHTISELDEVGSPLSRTVSYGLFLPVGLLLGVVALLAPTTALAGLAGCVGIGYVVAALFPCDVGSPLSGSSRQSIHNVGGTVEYIGSAYWLNQIEPPGFARDINLYTLAAGSLIVGSVLLSMPGLPLRGFIQRLMEGALFGCLLVSATP